MVRIKFLVILCVIITLAVCSEEELIKSKCRILALEGGGDKGSYEAGALKAFAEFLDPKELKYDVVTGISVGAINAAAVALHKKGKEKECINWINDLWLNMTSDHIYGKWPYGYIEGLLMQEGLYTNENEIDFLTELLEREFPDKKFHRKIIWNAVDFDSAEIVRFTEKEEWETVPKKIVASTSMPFAFPHMHLDNKTLVDGGSVWNVDYAAGISECLKEGYKEKDIIVDIILCTGMEANGTTGYNTIQNYMRYRNIKAYYTSMSDLDEIRRGYKDVNFRYLVVPKQPLPSGYIPLGFNHDSIVEMIRLGYEDASEVINLGEGESFDQVHSFVDGLHNVYS